MGIVNGVTNVPAFIGPGANVEPASLKMTSRNTESYINHVQ